MRYGQISSPEARLVKLMPNQYIFDQLLIFVNLDQHAKTEAASSIGSGEIADLKILHSDWLRAFWSISQKEEFFQIFL